jgi:hypothetical protein
MPATRTNSRILFSLSWAAEIRKYKGKNIFLIVTILKQEGIYEENIC